MNNTKAKDALLLVQESVLDTINSSRQHLADPKSSKEYIHNIRVDIKHLRAWLKLLKKKSSDINWREMDQCLSACAKELGAIRDDQVINATLDFLFNKAITKEDQAAITFVKEQLNSETEETTNISDELTSELLELLAIFEKNYVAIKSLSKLKNGYKDTFNKCDHIAKRVFSNNPDHKDIHKFRKWIKYFYYQSAYIRSAFPIKKRQIKETHKLGDMLGKAHDLIIIRDKLDLFNENYFIIVACGLIDENITLILKDSEPVFKKLFNTFEFNSIF